MADSKMKVGVIGGGWVSSARHIPAFQRLASVEIAAIYDRQLDRARATAKQFSIPSAHNDIEAFFAEGLDIVTICTPPWTHAPLAIRALENGCHVLTEKPMAMSTAETTDMITAANRAGKSLCVSHNFLFSRSLLKAKAMLAEGRLGEIQQVVGLQLSSPNRRLPTWHRDLPGGLFFDESPHLLYLIRHFLGDLDVTFTSATTDAHNSIANLQAQFQGTVANGLVTMCFNAPLSEWFLIVTGSRRVLLIDIFRDILTVLNSDGSHSTKDVLLSSVRSGLNLAGGFVSSGVLYTAGRLLYGHEVIIEKFVNSIIEGRPPPVTGEDGAQVIAMMEKILSSAGYLQEQTSPVRFGSIGAEATAAPETGFGA